MAETQQKQEVKLTEQQLMQMAQQEDYELASKKNLIERLAGALNETITTRETLKELKNAKGKIQVAIGATVLIEVTAENTKTCKRGFAQDGYKEETMDETIEWLTKKEEQLRKQLEKLQKDASASNARLTDIMGILKQIDGAKRNAQNRAPPTISK